MHINPDHFLETPEGRVATKERNAWAWEQCFAALDGALAACEPGKPIYVLVGAQGSGKSTWARIRKRQEPGCVIFDAILVKASERAPILLQARSMGVPAIAVWFHAPLAACLARNAARPPVEIANERGLRTVYAALEPPTEQEGFAHILHVEVASRATSSSQQST